MVAAAQVGMGYSIFGIDVHAPNFNPVDWYNAAKILLTSGKTNPANVLTQTLDQEQKDAIVQAEVQALTRAGMDPTLALAQATSDVTTVLLANNADPSQAATHLWQWIALGAAAVVVVVLLIKD